MQVGIVTKGSAGRVSLSSNAPLALVGVGGYSSKPWWPVASRDAIVCSVGSTTSALCCDGEQQHAQPALLMFRRRGIAGRSPALSPIGGFVCLERATVVYTCSRLLSSLSIRSRPCWRREIPFQAEAVWLGAQLSLSRHGFGCASGPLATVRGWGSLGDACSCSCGAPCADDFCLES